MADTQAAGTDVTCPRCTQPTPSLKQYALVEWFVCAFVYVWARRATFTACPKCMRIIILQRVAANLIPANVVMIVLAPIYLVQFFRTFAGGHSPEIQSEVEAMQRRREYRRVLAQAEVPALAAALSAVIERLDRGEHAAAMEELRAITARLEKGGDADLIMTDYVKWLEGGFFDALQHLFIPNQPELLRRPLAEILQRYTQHPPEELVQR